MKRAPFNPSRMATMTTEQADDYVLSFEPDEIPPQFLSMYVEMRLQVDLPAQLKWRPRPDKPERYDQQTAFYECQSKGVCWLLGGNGCTIASTPIYNPLTGIETEIGSIKSKHSVLALNPRTGELDIAEALCPYKKGEAPILAISFSDGRTIRCTHAHRFLNGLGTWVKAGQLRVGDSLLSPRLSGGDLLRESHVQSSFPLRSCRHDQSAQRYDKNEVRQRSTISASVQSAKTEEAFSKCDQRLTETVQGFQSDCPSLFHSCDEQLLSQVEVSRGAVPSPIDALERIPSGLLLDGQDDELRYSLRSELLCQHDLLSAVVRNEWSILPLLEAWKLCGGQSEDLFRLFSGRLHRDTSELLDDLLFSCTHPVKWTLPVCNMHVTVTEICSESSQPFYDFEVPGYGNYLACGVIHANSGTTETTMAKVANFVLSTPAPRSDTPFWVIGGSYEQSMETCWKEKLYGHGHIVDEDIDWDRVQWYRPKMQLPFRVPLLPQPCQADVALFRSLIPDQFPYQPNGNWCLEFKSWRQGADQMMARSIGGFAFVEQFPWGVFTEVNRGCREYSLPGAKMVEYTPVDPDLSGDIEEMVINGKKPADMSGHRPGMKYLPDNWEIFHANTECALEAGHVTKEWFEEYFGMIPAESLGMRLKGLFASYEGVIYKTFDPAIHVIGDEIYDQIISSGASHRRAIDWGAGPQNAFVCLWGARNRVNQWFVYDELYSVDQEKTVVDHLVDITRRHPWPNEPWYGTTYADPASPGNIRLAQQLAKYGPQNPKVPNLNMSMARNAVFEGIEHVRWLLKRTVPEWNEFTECLVNRPRLFIHYSCANLIREMKKYRWIKGKDPGTSDNPLNPRPEPLKFDDHSVDALRYLTFSDDSTLGLTIDSIRSVSKAAMNVAKSNGNWRDIVSGDSSSNERFGLASGKLVESRSRKLLGG